MTKLNVAPQAMVKVITAIKPKDGSCASNNAKIPKPPMAVPIIKSGLISQRLLNMPKVKLPIKPATLLKAKV